MELKDLQQEMCPRISAKDLVKLTKETPENVAIIDLRNNLDFKRAHIEKSINIPFTSVLLGEVSLDSLNVPNLESMLLHKIVIVISSHPENSILVIALFAL